MAVPDADFVPLINAIELALTTRLSSLFEKASEEGGAEAQDLEEQRKQIELRYRQASELVNSVTVDTRELLPAA